MNRISPTWQFSFNPGILQKRVKFSLWLFPLLFLMSKFCLLNPSLNTRSFAPFSYEKGKNWAQPKWMWCVFFLCWNLIVILRFEHPRALPAYTGWPFITSTVTQSYPNKPYMPQAYPYVTWKCHRQKSKAFSGLQIAFLVNSNNCYSNCLSCSNPNFFYE